jgi:translation initiation factor 2A
VRPRAFRITVEDVRVFASDSSGFVTCTEVVDADDSEGRWAGVRGQGGAVFRSSGGVLVLRWHLWVVGG